MLFAVFVYNVLSSVSQYLMLLNSEKEGTVATNMFV